MSEEFNIKQLLESKVKLNDGRVLPSFFVICQTGINSAAWKGDQIETVRQVKTQLDQLYQHLLKEYPEEAEQKEEKEEETVQGKDIDPKEEEPKEEPKAKKKQ